MQRLHLEVLGAFQLHAGGGAIGGPSAKKTQGLLTYLALQRGRVVARGHLANLLWSGAGDQKARHSLSEALSSLRKILDDAAPGVLELGSETVHLDPSFVEVDAAKFAELATRGDRAAMKRAASLYRGDLLEGLTIREPGFDAWLCAERARLRELAIKVLGVVAKAEAAAGRRDRAKATALRLLAIDPLSEPAHRLLMRLYAREGRTDAALRRFKTLEERLDRELATEPEAETYRLVQVITQSRTEAALKPEAATREAAPDEDVAIVVLPFADYSDDRDPNSLADGLTDDLITDLSRIRGLRVISRNTAFTYRNRVASLRVIASRLGVRYAVEGSIRRAGKQVRVNARLVDGRTESQVWSDRFDRNIENVFMLQNEITGRVSAALRLELLRAESDRMRKGPPANLTAWGHAIRGWAILWTRPIRRDSTMRAKVLFEKALDIDPSLALAWTGMARIHFIAGFYPIGIGERVESFARAVKAAEAAVALDPRSAEAYAELGAALKTRLRYDEALAASDTALDLNPNYEEAIIHRAMLMQATGRLDEAMALFDRSLRIAPHLPTDGRRAFFMAQTQLIANREREALALADKGVVFDPEFPGPRWVRASVFGLQGRKRLAATALDELLSRDRDLDTVEKVARQYRHIANMDQALDGLLRAGMRER